MSSNTRVRMCKRNWIHSLLRLCPVTRGLPVDGGSAQWSGLLKGGEGDVEDWETLICSAIVDRSGFAAAEPAKVECE
jgi:hypothetical protein